MGRADDEFAGITAGLVIEDRYRLEQVRDDTAAADGRRVVLWRALDLALDRRVAVLLASGRTRALRQQLAQAATRAGRVVDARCVRVLDVGELAAADRFTWIVTEWVDAPTLAAVVRRKTLPVDEAVALVRQCAQALATAAREGCTHGHLHPDRVLVPAAGLPRVTGLETARALAEDADSGPSDPGAADVRALGGLLVAALTGTWPLPGYAGLPRTPAGTRLRQRRRDAPKALDEIASRALAGRYPDPGAVDRALGDLPAPKPAQPAPPSPRALAARRWAWRLVPPALVAVLGAAGWVVGSDLGRVPLVARAHHPTLPAPSASAPGTGVLHLVWSSPPRVASFDPEGDGEENPSAVGLAVDNDPSTSWTTVTYRGSSHLGGLKPGVGLLLDLRRPTTVRVAELALTAPGSTVELRAGDQAPRTEADLAVVSATVGAGSQVRWQLPRPTTARYWLVWFTDLPKASGGYRIGVTEVALLG
ncbi:MAG: putative peptidoglycan lipid flippase [Frankiaceae bacterium]|nr:putative peptidoglycan lipid flippase [Frankiaceae bacterium]